jgi:8-oxo-dGTP pyrophosphatase MutT (NUDIX family)
MNKKFEVKMKKVQSSGIVLVRFENDVPLLLLMRAYSYWDFPKGGIEENENKLTAAIREVQEETGITELDFKWGKSYYETESYGKNKKVVFYFIANTTQSDIVMGISPQLGTPEHEEYKWVTFEEAKELTVERINKVISWVEERVFNIYKSESSPKSVIKNHKV